VRWVPPTIERLEEIAAHLREADRREVLASSGLGGREALLTSWKHSTECRCIEGDAGNPVGACGVNRSTIWLLGTDELLSTRSHRLQFAREGRKWVDGLIRDAIIEGRPPLLENMVCHRNAAAIRCLEFLGFEVFPPVPVGPTLELFSYFRRTE
jgi:hypothetical protein